MSESPAGSTNFVVGFNADVVSAIQDRTLERVFHDTMFPRILYRGEASPEEWPVNLGANQTFTRAGLIRPTTRPLSQHRDPTPKSWELEQWEVTAEQWGDAIDTHMPTSYVSLASIYLRNVHNLGLHAGQSLNRVVRDKLFNAYNAGNTNVSTAVGAGGNTVPVRSLNGLTRKLLNGRPQLVSSGNLLEITVITGGIAQVLQVTGFTPDFTGDEIHGGTLTISGTHAGVNVGDPVVAENASEVVRSGGGLSVDDITSADTFKLADIRAAVSQMRTNNVPTHDDGTYHCHLDPTSESQIFGDAVFNQLNTSIPDFVHYREFALAFLLGTTFYRNTEAPVVATVDQDPEFGFTFAPPLTNTPLVGDAVPIHRPIFTGQGSIEEKYLDESKYISEAGTVGKIGEFSVTNNGVQVMTDRVRLILRAPQDRLQQLTSAAWSWSGGFAIPTDAMAKTSSADFKRAVLIEHGA